MISALFYRDAWTGLETNVRTGEPAFASARVHGADMSGYLVTHPDDAVPPSPETRAAASKRALSDRLIRAPP
jgi:hypothetical protein